MKKLGSFALAAGAALALLAAPVLAQNAPSGMQGGMQGGMPGGMQGMKAATPAKKGMKTAAGKHTCMDYAWQSQDQKDCEAGKMMPPKGR
jgi:hypothetical protein